MEELLKLEQVSFSYEEDRPALENVTLALHRGERLAVLGENGAGKSTFFLCCNGVLTPRQGRVLLHGQPVGRGRADLARLRQAVGLVFQDPDAQIVAGTVESEVSFGPMNLGLDDGQARPLVEEALGQMRLQDFRSRAPQYLSGGEKKRVSIADILAMKPEVILFDEPTSSLDPSSVALLEQTLDELAGKDLSLVVSTHDIDFAWRWARRVVVFTKGRIAADGAPEAVFADRALLQSAGLRRPLLYEAASQLALKNSRLAGRPLPRSIQDWPAYIG